MTATAGPGQPELVGGSRDGVLAGAGEQDRVEAGPGQEVRVGLEVVAEVEVLGHSAEDADAAGVTAGLVAGVLDGCPHRLEQDAVLADRSTPPRGGSSRRTPRRTPRCRPSRPRHPRSRDRRRPRPAARRSTSLSRRTDSTPAQRLRQRVSTSGAPGKRPAMPTMAMPWTPSAQLTRHDLTARATRVRAQHDWTAPTRWVSRSTQSAVDRAVRGEARAAGVDRLPWSRGADAVAVGRRDRRPLRLGAGARVAAGGCRAPERPRAAAHGGRELALQEGGVLRHRRRAEERDHEDRLAQLRLHLVDEARRHAGRSHPARRSGRRCRPGRGRGCAASSRPGGAAAACVVRRTAVSSSGRVRTGDGRALRSTLPLALRGNCSSAMMVVGTMYSGSRSPRRARRLVDRERSPSGWAT